MGVYSVVKESSINLDSAGIIECVHDNMLEASLNIVAETAHNYGLMMKQIGVEELCYYEENGKEMEYVNEAADGFFGKVKEFFMNIWEKIKGLFKKFFAMFDSVAKTDKEFAAKYKKDLFNISHSLKDFKYKGYDFTIDKVEVEKSAKAMENGEIKKCAHWEEMLHNVSAADVEEAKKIREDFSDTVEKMRASAIGQSGALTASELSKELFQLFRNGETEKQELENPNLSNIINELEGSAKLKKDAEKAFTDLEKIIKYNINAVEKGRNALIKNKMPKEGDSKFSGETMSSTQITNSDAIVVANVGISIAKEILAISQTINGALLTAIKDNMRQNKAICVSLLSYKPKKEGATTGWAHNESSFLSGVNFK